MKNILCLLIGIQFTMSCNNVPNNVHEISGILYFKRIGISDDMFLKWNIIEQDSLFQSTTSINDQKILRDEYSFRKENNLLDKRTFLIKDHNSEKIFRVFVNSEDFSQIDKYNLNKLLENGHIVDITMKAKKLKDLNYYAIKIDSIELKNGKTPWSK